MVNVVDVTNINVVVPLADALVESVIVVSVELDTVGVPGVNPVPPQSTEPFGGLKSSLDTVTVGDPDTVVASIAIKILSGFTSVRFKDCFEYVFA